LKEPHKDAIAVYRYAIATGKKQTELAEDTKLMSMLGRPVDQGTISRWLKKVRTWLEAGNVLPDHLEVSRSTPKPIDPERLDLGRRRDGLTPRQRPRRSDDYD
jgi:hypothetical protein